MTVASISVDNYTLNGSFPTISSNLHQSTVFQMENTSPMLAGSMLNISPSFNALTQGSVGHVIYDGVDNGNLHHASFQANNLVNDFYRANPTLPGSDLSAQYVSQACRDEPVMTAPYGFLEHPSQAKQIE
jgi:hypothetical protein